METTCIIKDFCTQCGAQFPPKPGEGHCKLWILCYEEQTGNTHYGQVKTDSSESTLGNP